MAASSPRMPLASQVTPLDRGRETDLRMAHDAVVPIRGQVPQKGLWGEMLAAGSGTVSPHARS
jgi:hypothetical protein